MKDLPDPNSIFTPSVVDPSTQEGVFTVNENTVSFTTGAIGINADDLPEATVTAWLRPFQWFQTHTKDFIAFGVEPCAFVQMLLSQFPAGTVTLAGGAARSVYTKEPVMDYDLWMPHCDQSSRLDDLLQGPMPTKVINTSTADTLTNVDVAGRIVQFCCSGIGYHPKQLINTFDFTLCQFAIQRQIVDGKSCYAMTTTAQALSDAHKRVLRLVNLQYPVDTLKRIPKYVERGWKADFTFYHELFKHLQEGNWNPQKLTPHSDEFYVPKDKPKNVHKVDGVHAVDDPATLRGLSESEKAAFDRWYGEYVTAPAGKQLESQNTSDSKKANPAAFPWSELLF